MIPSDLKLRHIAKEEDNEEEDDNPPNPRERNDLVSSRERSNSPKGKGTDLICRGQCHDLSLLLLPRPATCPFAWSRLVRHYRSSNLFICGGF